MSIKPIGVWTLSHEHYQFIGSNTRHWKVPPSFGSLIGHAINGRVSRHRKIRVLNELAFRRIHRSESTATRMEPEETPAPYHNVKLTRCKRAAIKRMTCRTTWVADSTYLSHSAYFNYGNMRYFIGSETDPKFVWEKLRCRTDNIGHSVVITLSAWGFSSLVGGIFGA